MNDKWKQLFLFILGHFFDYLRWKIWQIVLENISVTRMGIVFTRADTEYNKKSDNFNSTKNKTNDNATYK